MQLTKLLAAAGLTAAILMSVPATAQPAPMRHRVMHHERMVHHMKMMHHKRMMMHHKRMMMRR